MTKVAETKAHPPLRLAEAIDEIRQGLPWSAIERTRKNLGVDDVTLGRLLGISPRTMTRRKERKAPLDANESDRLYRMTRVVALAEEVFENQGVAVEWMQEANEALGGVPPLSLLDTDPGTEAVVTLLEQIEYGVYR